MYDIINEEINYDMNKKLIDIMCKYCDAFSFHLTNYYKTCRSISDINESDGKKYLRYKESLLPIINRFNNYVLKNYISLDYLGFHYNNKMEIFVIKLNATTRDILTENDSIMSWNYPNMPEDLCFFNKGVCVLRSVSHENLMFLYTHNDDLIKKLIDAGFILERTLDEKVPRMAY